MSYGKDAKIPYDAKLSVSELKENSDKYRSAKEAAVEEKKKDNKDFDEQSMGMAALDITILNSSGKEIEPAKNAKVDVKIEMTKLPDTANVSSVEVQHIKNDTATTVADTATKTKGEVSVDNKDTAVTADFSIDHFSTFTIIWSDEVLANQLKYEGEDYTIIVSYDDDAEIPKETKLEVQEIKKDSDEFLQYLGKAWNETNKDYLENEGKDREELHYNPEASNPKNIIDARFFDIKLMKGETKIEPKTEAHVQITYKKGLEASDKAEGKVVHFADKETELINPEVKNADNEITEYNYKQSSFSVVGTFTEIQSHDNVDSKSRARLLATSNDNSGSSLPALNASKTVTPNGDGTYKLNLSVQGAENTSEQTNIKKANVVIVMDTSDSMDTKTGYAIYSGKTYDPNITYYRANESGGYNFLVYYQGSLYRQSDRGHMRPYTGTVYIATTRLSDERTALKSMVGSLLSQNNPAKENQGDVVEVSFITFASTASLRVSKSTNESALDSIIDSGRQDGIWYSRSYGDLYRDDNDPNRQPTGYDSYSSNTNWEWALNLANQEVANYKQQQPNESTYVIFLTDGEPTAQGTSLSSVNYYSSNNEIYQMMRYAEPSARSIVDTNGATLYNVFTYGDDDSVEYLQRLTNYAYDEREGYDYTRYNNKYFFDARDTTAITNVFSNLVNTISSSTAYGKVDVTDDITTDVTSTSVTTNGTPHNIQYTVTNSSGNKVFTAAQTDSGMTVTVQGKDYIATQKTATIDGQPYNYYSTTVSGTEYKIAPATVSDDGKITWNLAGIGTLPPDYVYNLSCSVWPNQTAYDLVAELNNGSNIGLSWDEKIAVSHTDSLGRTYFLGGFATYPYIARYENEDESFTYAVMSNSRQSVTYAEANTNNGTTTYGDSQSKDLATPDPMALTDTIMNVKKTWQASLDSSQIKLGDSVTLELRRDKDPTAYKSFTFTAGEATNGSYTSDPQSAHLAAGLMVSVDKAQPGVSSSKTITVGNKKYYVLNAGHDYTLTELNTNYHWEFTGATYHPMIVDGSLMNATVDSAGDITSLSEFSADVTGTNTLRGGINVRKVVKALDGSTDISNQVGNQEFTITAHLKDKDGRAITYSSYGFTDKARATKTQQDSYPIWYEVLQDNDYDGIADTGSDGKPVVSTSGQMLQDDEKFTIKTDQIVRLINVPSGTKYSFTEDSVPTGYEKVNVAPDTTSIATLNSEGDVVVTNKIQPLEITVKKISDSGNALTGAVFSLTKKNASGDYTSDGLTNARVTVDNANGVKVSNLDVGDYKLSEVTAPAGYIVENADTYFKVAVGNNGTAVVNVVSDKTDLHYNDKASSDGNTITVKNKAGQALPNTGGHGTLPFVLGGMFLISAAGMLYIISKKRSALN